jgi:hypothetical protein
MNVLYSKELLGLATGTDIERESGETIREYKFVREAPAKRDKIEIGQGWQGGRKGRKVAARRP